MAVGNPTLQRALAERRAALGMSQPDPEAGTSTDPNPSANYFDDDDFPSALRGIDFLVNVTRTLRRNLRYDERLTTKRVSMLIRRKAPITTNLQRILPS
ncbi:hypothetical protein YC2023_014422 [Brassica napus]